MLEKVVSTIRSTVFAPVKRRVRKVLSGSANSATVFVGMASIPSREASLRKVVESLLPQVSELGVYLNNWETVPDFLKHPKIRIARSQDHGDVRDNGKFFWVERTKARFYATVDDDIHYPSNYISELLRYQQMLGGTYAVGVHASTYPRPVTRLLKNRHLIHFSHASDALIPVDMLGTGTLFFERAYWNFKYSEMGTPGMADVWFASGAVSRRFGLWSVPRPQNWLRAIEQEDPTDNLFREGRLDDSIQVRELNRVSLGSSRRSQLERLVRAPLASARFAITDAQALDAAATQVQLAPLKDSEFRFYSSALATHKREHNRSLHPKLDSLLESYVLYLLHQASGGHYTEDYVFVDEYRDVIKSIGFKSLPEFAQRDWRYFGFKASKSAARLDRT